MTVTGLISEESKITKTAVQNFESVPHTGGFCSTNTSIINLVWKDVGSGRAGGGVVTKTVTWGGGGKEIVTNGDKGGRGGQNPGFFGDVIVEWPLKQNQRIIITHFIAKYNSLWHFYRKTQCV